MPRVIRTCIVNARALDGLRVSRGCNLGRQPREVWEDCALANPGDREVDPEALHTLGGNGEPSEARVEFAVLVERPSVTAMQREHSTL